MSDSIAYSLGFEYFMSRLFGKSRYHSTTGIPPTAAMWRKELLRIAVIIRQAVSANVKATDRLHREELLDRCNSVQTALRAAKGINELNLAMIQHLAEVSFLLMGGLPSNWKGSHVSGPRGWKLDAVRSVVYFQTPEQKVQLILDQARRHNRTLHDQMMDQLFRLRTNPNRIGVFLKWVRQNHEDFYLTLF